MLVKSVPYYCEWKRAFVKFDNNIRLSGYSLLSESVASGGMYLSLYALHLSK